MATYVPILDAEVAPESPGTTSLFTRLRDNALSYLGAPSGTKLILPQASAPLGWQKDTTHNDKALRVVSGGTGGGSGGSSPFSTVFGKTATDPVTLNTANLPAYTPIGSFGGTAIGTSQIQIGGAVAGTIQYLTKLNGGTSDGWGLAVAGTFTGTPQGGTSTAFSHGMDIRVQYLDVIVAQKD